jgi:hypothetical protein
LASRSKSGGRRDVQRNSAYFLGAAGTAAGVFGGAFSVLEVGATWFPAALQSTPDWLIAVALIVVIVLMGGGWPALDWLVNRRPVLGATTMVTIGLASISVGLAAAFGGPWGLMGWFAAAGGVCLLLSACLVVSGGGTEPLVWRSMRTEQVRVTEARVGAFAQGVIRLVSVASFILLIVAAIDGYDWVTLGILAIVGVAGLGWIAIRR